MRENALPLAVRGPVDFLALRWLAARRAGVITGDFLRDIVGVPELLQSYATTR